MWMVRGGLSTVESGSTDADEMDYDYEIDEDKIEPDRIG